MKRLFFISLLLFPFLIQAQNIKTDVLVIGSGNAAFAAVVQANLSSVNVTALTQSDGFKLDDLFTLDENGTSIAFVKQARKSLKLPDSVALPQFNFQMSNVVINKWSDSSKTFKVINNISYTEIKRAGSGWKIKLSNGTDIKAKVLVLAEPSDNLLKVLKIDAIKPAEVFAFSYGDNLYRTSIAGVNKTTQPSFLPLSNLLIPNQENLIYIPTDYFEVGQAAGATASYAAFFNTKTSLSNLKKIQIELLTYKCALLPFEDIKLTDSNWLAIQKVATTGLLKGEFKNGKLLFNPDELVTYNEIKQPLKDYYYKAQIWFDDHVDVPINLENSISLVATLGNKSPEATKLALEKDWLKVYGFKSNFDMKKLLTRREFSALVSVYLNPFDFIQVDRTGRILR